MRWLQVYAHGCAIIVGISQSHKAQVHSIYSFLIGNDIGLIWILIDLFFALFIVVLLVYLWQAITSPDWRRGFLELIVLLIVFSQLPPLVSFALYFCCLIPSVISDLYGDHYVCLCRCGKFTNKSLCLLR